MRQITTLLLMCCATFTFGQQVPQFSQYLRNQYLVNPGAAGVYDFLDIAAGGRMQWLGFDDAPMSSYLYVSKSLEKTSRSRYNPGIRVSSGPVRNPEIKTGKLKHAVGGLFLADQYGAFRQMRFAGTYALHVPISRSYNMSFGTSVGLSNRSFLKDRAQTLNMMTGIGTDATYDTYSQQATRYTLDVAAGLYVYSKRAFVGVSAEQLTRDFVSFGTGTANFDPNMHFTATAGYKFDLNENLTIMPAVLAKFMQPAPLSFEGSIQLEYKEWLWFGTSYRSTDAMVLMAGMNISQRFKFGYSFDFSVSQFNQYSAGGHELVLGIMLGR